MMDYRVSLSSFHGPLDLLLYLVKRDEVDIHEVSITKLVEQFLDFLSVMKELDVEIAGEFLVVAATLLEIKVRALLPSKEAPATDDPTTPATDPRRELVKQLLEYRRFKDAAAALEQRAEKQSIRLARIPTDEVETRPAGVAPVELWDLVSAFARILKETRTVATTITTDDTPQHVYEEQIAALVEQLGNLPFQDIFTPPYTKSRLIGLFLALLELVKQQRVKLEQAEPFGAIMVCLSR